MARIPAVLLLLLLWPFQALAEPTRLCNIEIEAPESIDFTSTEEKWLCGDKESANWRRIPLSQQKLFLESFLQSKGYHRPDFREEGEKLLVNVGGPLKVESFTVKGAPPAWNWAKRWRIKGELLNQETLDGESAWAKRRLQEIGYPCPEVEARALIDTGELQLLARPGSDYRFSTIESGGTGDLDPAVLERFTAFVPGQNFDVRLLDLTSTRILDEDLYLSTYFDLLCGENGPPRIIRRSVPALPRLFTVGAGFDTEQGPLARARMRWSKLGKSASSLQISLFASIREQRLSGNFNYYFLSDPGSRLHLIPSFSVDRQMEENFITVTSQLGTRLAYSWEFPRLQLYGEAGPVLERTNQRRGEGPKKVDNLRLTTRISATSHMFEYYLTDPREGWMASLETGTQFSGILSEENIHRLLLEHQVLWNLGNWDPPFLILGWRGTLGTYFFRDRSRAGETVPVSQRYFLGGDENIRGFSRKELPGNGAGFFTLFYLGWELRTGSWFPLGLEPFLLFDWAKGGADPHRLKNTNYYSPGLGLRYKSPFGTVRATLAKGFVGNRDPSDPLPHWQFFFSFGKEF